MVKEIRIHFEGAPALREGIRKFLAAIDNAARAEGVPFKLIAGGGTAERYYRIALQEHPDAWNVLLRDSDGPEPPKSDDDNHFWMVQLMESWFLADPEALAAYYGEGFNVGTLKKNPRIEGIPKGDVLSCLRQATRNAQKRSYHKTQHAPAILERINPTKVRNAAPHCEALFQRLLAGLDQGL